MDETRRADDAKRDGVVTPTRIGDWIFGFGGRRYVMTMGAGITNTALFVFGLLTENGYITLTGMTVGAYLAANTIEGFRNGGKGGSDAVADK